MQVRLRSSWPSKAFFTRFGSAISARAAPTTSQTPEAIAASPSAMEVRRPRTHSTGTFARRLAYRLGVGAVDMRFDENGRHAEPELVGLDGHVEST